MGVGVSCNASCVRGANPQGPTRGQADCASTCPPSIPNRPGDRVGAVAAGEAGVDVDPLRRHPTSIPFDAPYRTFHRTGLTGHSPPRISAALGVALACTGKRSPYGIADVKLGAALTHVISRAVGAA